MTHGDSFLSQFPVSIGDKKCRVVQVDAVDGRDSVYLESHTCEIGIEHRGSLSSVELACTISYLNATQTAAREPDLEYAIVCEDDADFRLYAC